MKKRLLLTVLFVVFVVNGAIAGSGSLVGDWVGEARAIYPDGTIFEQIPLTGKLEDLQGGLFRGTFTFTVPGLGEVTAYATGYIRAQKIQGLMSVEDASSLSGYSGIGVFNANLKGKKMTGVVHDFSDGSTAYFTAKKQSN